MKASQVPACEGFAIYKGLAKIDRLGRVQMLNIEAAESVGASSLPLRMAYCVLRTSSLMLSDLASGFVVTRPSSAVYVVPPPPLLALATASAPADPPQGDDPPSPTNAMLAGSLCALLSSPAEM